MKVVIVGGGFAGIGAAIKLANKGHSITIIEPQERLGGLAYAFKKNEKFIHTGYHQILSTDKPLIELFNILNMREKISWKRTKIKFLLNNKIYDFSNPKDFLLMPLSPAAKIRFITFMLYCFSKKNWKNLEGESAERWIGKLAGREVLQKIFSPLINIKFGLNPSQVSATWVGSRLSSREGSSPFGCIPGKEWTTELCASASRFLKQKGVKIQLNTSVTKIIHNNNKIQGVMTNKGKIDADVVISTVSPIILKRLITINDPNLDIDYIDSISTIMSVKNNKQDFYWLVCLHPRMFMGGLFNLTSLNPTLMNDEIILNFFTNMNHNDSKFNISDTELLRHYQNDYQSIYGSTLAINWYKVNRIPLVSAKYTKGYKNPSMITSIKGLYLCGNYMSYPSVTSTGTALETGFKVATLIR